MREYPAASMVEIYFPIHGRGRSARRNDSNVDKTPKESLQTVAGAGLKAAPLEPTQNKTGVVLAELDRSSGAPGAAPLLHRNKSCSVDTGGGKGKGK